KNDNISTYLENTNRTVGLAYDHKGRLIGTQSRDPKGGVLSPTRQVLADKCEGQPLVRPNDLVIAKNNGIYFSDPIPNAQAAFRQPPPGRKPLLFYIRPDGQLMKLTEEVTAPNGVQLSPDEKTLYATNGNRIMAFDVMPDGSVKNGRTLAMSGGGGARHSCIQSAGPRLGHYSLRHTPSERWLCRASKEDAIYRWPRCALQDSDDCGRDQESS